VAPVFVDAYEQPGHLLYRFDAIIVNQGGTLDLFKDAGGRVHQAVYVGGEPAPADKPRPDLAPSGAQLLDQSGNGAQFVYAKEKTHQHWHFSSAARYELQPQGGTPRVSDKVGFCLFDSYLPEPANLFDYSVQGPGDETWCGFNHPNQPTVRMGLSPGGADIYSAQTERQWVDITGLAPGPAVMRVVANPLHCVLEADSANNTTSEARRIPGVRVVDAAGSTGAAPVTMALSGAVVAPEVPARRPGGCVPGRTSTGCYVWASAAGPLRFAVTREPAHGTVALGPGADGLHAVATYAPDAGFTGVDTFAYAATDARGLTSEPATVRVGASAPAAAAPAPPAAAPALARLSGIRVLRRHGGWFVTLRASLPAVLSARLQRGTRRSRRLRTRILDAGRARIPLGRLRPGRYRLRLRLDGRPAGNVSFRSASRVASRLDVAWLPSDT
jgi:hypothetical protein